MTHFYIEKFDFNQPKEIEDAFKQLLDQPIQTLDQLKSWLKQQSDLDEALEEALSGHYIDFQCQSDSRKAKERFEHDQNVIEPMYKKYDFLLTNKLLDSPLVNQLNSDIYEQFIKRKKNAKNIFSLENVDLEVKEDALVTQYFEITGSITVIFEGEELTLSQLTPYYEDANRNKREKAVTLAAEAILLKEKDLQVIMDQLVKLRHQKAMNRNLSNYRDYMFKKYERFDYTAEDCKQLAESIRKYVKPLKEKLQKKHQQEIGVDTYKPWDRYAVPIGQSTLKPFKTSNELIEKTRTILNKLDPRFSHLLTSMNEKGMLDLNSRKGKSPGGFCSALPLSKLSFIFMNASKTHDDMITLIHEMGHCIHNDLMKDQPISDYREAPMESAELASMSMELLTMDQWNTFYEKKTELKRAMTMQLRGIIDFLPQGMVIDQFQHWMYENPKHSAQERNKQYQEIAKQLDSNYVDWSNYEKWQQTAWMRVLHIFEVPFYYIEYVIAQLGALQIYKQYRENPQQALERYKSALALGSSKSLPEVYEAAGIRFDFSETTIKELMTFLESELEVIDL
ncbi:M3 family oligoendopeptidase [Halalkalibacter krulwichiae]|uniref:Oligoendopeptidase F, plasmid n=1 Tax=Halalkalibacter krulwichiae TaxID=199441 RepID=A0A1X9MAX6_9BACI|nr:M3 family oligoendopeptidase [Halalkalibacter krulwichiae]ARK30558.1 Oligoendopeptidase F, plasmid [Halalkalibacter krulwichiae]